MRLLIVTARYPTVDRPAAGAFVKDRIGSPDLTAVVVGPTRYDRPGWLRYLSLTWRALTVRGRFDGVEGHFVLPSGLVALLAARIRRLPFVVYAHGSDVRDWAQRNPVFRWLAGRVLLGAGAVVANSEETASYVRRFGREAQVVPPGIDLARFRPSPRPAGGGVLYLGGADPAKGFALAQALATTLAGPGIREVHPDEVPALIAAHDVVLVPSLAESFGLVAAEAIASGRWVVARAVGGLPTVVTDGLNGFLSETDEGLRDALARIPDYDPIAVAATARRFSLDRYRIGMSDVWTRLLGKPAEEQVS